MIGDNADITAIASDITPVGTVAQAILEVAEKKRLEREEYERRKHEKKKDCDKDSASKT